MKFKKIKYLFLALLVSFLAKAEDNSKLSIHDNGKIYVVVVSIAIILGGIFVYLWRLEKKIKKLHSQIKDNE
jgi:CcmD family protein